MDILIGGGQHLMRQIYLIKVAATDAFVRLGRLRMYQLVERNDDYVLVNKAPGLTVQSEDGQPGLLQLVAADLGLKKLFPVHRIDKMTSGLVIMAVTTEANRQLSEKFRLRQMEKFYLAVSDKKPRKKQGAVVGDMDKARRGAWKLLSRRDNPAITQFFSTSLMPGQRLFVVKPHTGKTHQIRVALKSVGAPITGDTLYHGAVGAEESEADRGYLHAYSLRFDWHGQIRSYQCLPAQGALFSGEEFTQALASYREPWTLNWPKL